MKVRGRRWGGIILASGPVIGAAVGAVTNLITTTWNWWLFLALVLLVSLAAATVVASTPHQNDPIASETDHGRNRPISALPPRPAVFVGRNRELDRLSSRSGLQAASAGRPTIYMITDGPGSGKTTLATHAAHRMADRYPDGQLYFSFRSYAGAASRLGAQDVLMQAINAISPGSSQRDLDAEQLSARWRSDTSGKRMLIVLDDVADLAQVAPLLPNSGRCAVVITCRRVIPGIDADVHIELGGLSSDDAAVMIREITDRASITIDDRLIKSLARVYTLPLSIRHVADQLVTGSTDRVRVRIQDQEDPEDPTAAFRATVAILSPVEQLVFRRVALYPGKHATATTVGVLAGIARDDADAAIATLHARGLIGKPDPYGYQFHDLVRALAMEYSEADDSDADRASARQRLFNLTAETLVELNALINMLPGADTAVRPVHREGAVHDELSALDWFERYFEDMRAVARLAVGSEWPGTWQLASGLAYFTRIRGNIPQAIELLESGLQIAVTLGDDLGKAVSFLEIGTLWRAMSNYASAQEYVDMALPLFETRNDLIGEAGCFLELGTISHMLSRYEDARERHIRALSLFERARYGRGVAQANAVLGMLNRLLGDYRSAQPYLENALAAFIGMGSLRNRAWMLIELGTIDRQLGRYQQAQERFEQARELYDSADDRNGRAWADRELGIVFRMIGNYPAAERLLSQSLAVFSDMERKRNVADATIELATLHRVTGQLAQVHREAAGALELYQGIRNIRGAAWTEIELSIIERLSGYPGSVRRLERVLTVYRDLGDQSGLARVYLELGIAATENDNNAAARDYLTSAQSLYESIGSPEADSVIARLAAL